MIVAEPIRITRIITKAFELQVQSERLDLDYLVKRAEQREISELLKKALKESSEINE